MKPRQLSAFAATSEDLPLFSMTAQAAHLDTYAPAETPKPQPLFDLRPQMARPETNAELRQAVEEEETPPDYTNWFAIMQRCDHDWRLRVVVWANNSREACEYFASQYPREDYRYKAMTIAALAKYDLLQAERARWQIRRKEEM